MQQFDSAGCDARVELETDQRVRHAVAVFVDLDVIVDVNRHCLEARELVGLCRQRLQCRRVQLGECAGATSRQLLERPLIQVLEQRADRLIDRVDRLKPVMTQARHDPAFDDLDRNLYLWFVLRTIYARRKE